MAKFIYLLSLVIFFLCFPFYIYSLALCCEGCGVSFGIYSLIEILAIIGIIGGHDHANTRDN